VVAQYYEFIRLGHEGYAKVHDACYHAARHIGEAIGALPAFELVYDADPQRGITAATWRIADGADPGFNLFEDRALETLRRHPPSASLTEQEAGGFSHDARPAR
jgi:glutamate/tyrosine decarboxylase-like PLP-dependent enzyme